MRILGIDIGAENIKALELDVRFGRVELVDYLVERVIPDEPLPVNAEAAKDSSPAANSEEPLPARRILSSAQAKALEKLLKDKDVSQSRVVINVPGSLVTSRLLTFPTKDRKVIQRSIGFELEDEIPLDLENVVYDFVVLASQTQASSVYTSLILKKDLHGLLADLGDFGLDPDVVTTEAWAMHYLLEKTLPDSAPVEPICLVNLGAATTSIHLFMGSHPIFTHHVPVGGNKISRAIESAFRISLPEAHTAKMESAFVLTPSQFAGTNSSEPLTEDQKRFSKTISDALAPVVRDIKQSLMSFKSQYHLRPQEVIITGGSSLITNLVPYLSESLGIPVKSLNYSQQVAGSALQLSTDTQAEFSVAMALALTGIKPARGQCVNFRKDEFVKQGGAGLSFSLKELKTPLRIAVASLAFVYANLLVQYFLMSHRLDEQELSLERAARAVLGSGVSKSSLATYINSQSALKSAVEKEVAKVKPTTVEPPKVPTSAFEVLHKVSAAFPNDLTLDVTLFEYKQDQFKFQALVNQPQDSDRIFKILDDMKLFSGIAKGPVEEDVKLKKFKIEVATASGTPKNDAPAATPEKKTK